MRKKLGAFALLLILTVLLGSLLIGHHYKVHFARLSDQDPGMLRSTASIVILVGMFGLCASAYNVYKDVFWALLGVGWLANGLYLFFEGFYPAAPLSELQKSIFLLSHIPTVAFFVASFVTPSQDIPMGRVARDLGLWLSAILLSYRFAHPDVLLLVGVLFSAVALWRTGKALVSRLSPEVHRSLATIFPWTFYLYALIQFLYLANSSFLPVPDGCRKVIMHVGFSLGLGFKVISAVCAIVIIQRDFTRIHDQQKGVRFLDDLGALVGALEHEIKNPLQAIGNHLYTLGQKYQNNDDIQKRLAKLEKERDRIYAAMQVVNAFRGGRDFYEPRMTKTSLGDLVRRSVNAVKDELEPDHILFKVEDRVPLYTKAYQPVLQQVFVNLLKNAVEAIRQSGRASGIVKVMLQPPSHHGTILTVAISDNGCGIPEVNMPMLGHLFSTKHGKKPNSGIGLFISQRILEVHSGSLRMTSEEGVGTTASVRLPVWTPDGAEGSPTQDESEIVNEQERKIEKEKN